MNWDRGNNKFPSKEKILTQKSNDYSLIFSNSHVFSIDDLLKKGDDFFITPEADVLCGTQIFLVKHKGKTNPTDKIYQKQAAKFNLTGYLLSLELKYKIKKFTLELTPTYIIPENVPAGESSTPYFVMNASVYFTFKKKK